MRSLSLVVLVWGVHCVFSKSNDCVVRESLLSKHNNNECVAFSLQHRNHFVSSVHAALVSVLLKLLALQSMLPWTL